MHLKEASQGVSSAAVDESADTPDETPEGSSDADEDGLTRLEEELAMIEAAMDRIDNGDLHALLSGRSTDLAVRRPSDAV